MSDKSAIEARKNVTINRFIISNTIRRRHYSNNYVARVRQ